MDSKKLESLLKEAYMWIKFKKEQPKNGQHVMVKFKNGEEFKGVNEGNFVSFTRGNFPSPEALIGGQLEWRALEEK